MKRAALPTRRCRARCVAPASPEGECAARATIHEQVAIDEREDRANGRLRSEGGRIPYTRMSASTDAGAAISPYRRSFEDETARVLGRAFSSDPVFQWMVQGDVALSTWCRRQGIRRCAPHGASFVVGDRMRGAACWIPPEVQPNASSTRQVAMGNLRAPIVCRLGGTVRILVREADARARYERHVRKATWILALLGVDPGHQGHGLGRALMQHGLSFVDRDRRPAYLITYSEPNVAFYRSFGFEIIDFTSPPELPRAWSMRRPAGIAPIAALSGGAVARAAGRERRGRGLAQPGGAIGAPARRQHP